MSNPEGFPYPNHQTLPTVRWPRQRTRLTAHTHYYINEKKITCNLFILQVLDPSQFSRCFLQ